MGIHCVLKVEFSLCEVDTPRRGCKYCPPPNYLGNLISFLLQLFIKVFFKEVKQTDF